MIENLRATLRAGRVTVSFTLPLTADPMAETLAETPCLPAIPADDTPDDRPADGGSGRPLSRRQARHCVTHGPDHAAVNWYGVLYTFAPKQRIVIAALLNARDQCYDWVSQEVLLELAESDSGKLRELFCRHPAWGTLIVSALHHGGPAGAYRLATPPEA